MQIQPYSDPQMLESSTFWRQRLLASITRPCTHLQLVARMFREKSDPLLQSARNINVPISGVRWYARTSSGTQKLRFLEPSLLIWLPMFFAISASVIFLLKIFVHIHFLWIIDIFVLFSQYHFHVSRVLTHWLTKPPLMVYGIYQF